MGEHEGRLLTKQGSEWTNDLGQTFPAAPLYRCECACGWRGAAWYSAPSRARGHYDRHVEEVMADGG